MASHPVILPVILSGGSGTRLWPMSRPEMPKQLLALAGEGTMLQQTASRTADRARFAAPVIVGNARHADVIGAQLAAIGIDDAQLLLEPCARKTAPAIALAAVAAGADDTVLLVMPSDQVIADPDAFHAAIDAALPQVADGWLATFGIQPHAPETGYGYIQAGEGIAPGVHRVLRFVEKPPVERAQAMIASGDHAWNGGIFMFRADRYLAVLRHHAPAMADVAQAAMDAARTEGNRILPDAQAFAASPADSIDYAVMEKADRVAVVPVDMGWSDLGSWDALYAISDLDAAGNACDGSVLTIEARNCLIRSDGLKVSIVGVEDLIVVASGDEVLILPRGRSQEVKKVIAAREQSR